jgi:hypothetical protein
MIFYSSAIFVLMFCIFNVNPVIASDWKYITTDEHGQYFYNISSFEKLKHDLYLVTVKEEYTIHVDNVISETVLLEEIDCYSHNYINKTMTTHYTDKSSITVNFADTKWRDVEYGTSQLDIIIQICH